MAADTGAALTPAWRFVAPPHGRRDREHMNAVQAVGTSRAELLSQSWDNELPTGTHLLDATNVLRPVVNSSVCLRRES